MRFNSRALRYIVHGLIRIYCHEVSSCKGMCMFVKKLLKRKNVIEVSCVNPEYGDVMSDNEISDDSWAET